MNYENDRTCPNCRFDLESERFCLLDLDYDRWSGEANMMCPKCGAALIVQEVEVRIGLYGGGSYYPTRLAEPSA